MDLIVLTRLNNTRVAVNADLIERIQQNPDTVVIMANGAKYVVRETMEDVVSLCAGYRARVISLARLHDRATH